MISYNHVSLAAAEELLEAAAIMDMQVFIGIEFFARFHEGFVKLIWVPRGLADARGFLDFLSSPPVQRLMDMGREVSKYYELYVLDVLRFFNEYRLGAINQEFGIRITSYNVCYTKLLRMPSFAIRSMFGVWYPISPCV